MLVYYLPVTKTISGFWATVYKMFRPILSDRCPICHVMSVCNVDVLWPNGWMDQMHGWPLGTEVGLGPGDIYILKSEASVCATVSASINPLHSDTARCCNRYTRCQRSLAVKPLNSRPAMQTVHPIGRRRWRCEIQPASQPAQWHWQ